MSGVIAYPNDSEKQREFEIFVKGFLMNEFEKYQEKKLINENIQKSVGNFKIYCDEIKSNKSYMNMICHRYVKNKPINFSLVEALIEYVKNKQNRHYITVNNMNHDDWKKTQDIVFNNRHILPAMSDQYIVFEYSFFSHNQKNKMCETVKLEWTAQGTQKTIKLFESIQNIKKFCVVDRTVHDNSFKVDTTQKNTFIIVYYFLVDC